MLCGEILKEFSSKEEQTKRERRAMCGQGRCFVGFVLIQFFTLEIYQQVYVPVGIV